MEIYHLALASDWAAAVDAGDYRVSTRGVTLEQEGFIHCSHADQWRGVRQAFYADVTEPLVLLTIDTERLGSPWQEDEVPGADRPFPHVYGPIDLDAVVAVVPVPAPGSAGQ
jgi:glutathione S-transferase